MGKELIERNVSGLLRLVRKLAWDRSASTWADYAENSPYGEEDRRRKRRFVADAAATRRWPMTWDLGANTGEFSRLAAAHSDSVVAMDSDHLTVQRLFASLESDAGTDNILPLVVDLASPSPGIGWRGAERKPLGERGKPDLVLALALLHHLVLTANVPVADVLDWLHSLGGHLVLEFVDKSDPMPRQLLLNKIDNYRDYEKDAFHALFERRFEVLREESLCEGRRQLFFARPR
jgi:ribosomal protein L11 methylase PrmA